MADDHPKDCDTTLTPIAGEVMTAMLEVRELLEAKIAELGMFPRTEAQQRGINAAYQGLADLAAAFSVADDRQRFVHVNALTGEVFARSGTYVPALHWMTPDGGLYSIDPQDFEIVLTGSIDPAALETETRQ